MQHVESERRTMMQNYPDFYPLAATAVLIAIGIGIGWLLFASDRLDGYGTNVWTEVLSIGVTVAVIDRLNQRRAAQQRKTALIQQLGSRSNDFALEAVRLLRQMGILTDGTLKNVNLSRAILSHADLSGAKLMRAKLSGAGLRSVDLSGANLEVSDLSGADLTGANLSSVVLRFVDLSGADLTGANLSGANLYFSSLSKVFLRGANLSGADLGEADLSGVYLKDANLSNADLARANLSGAYLYDANLSSAKLGGVIFDENTQLPDRSLWTLGTDLTRFTDPEHANFWRSDNPFSPAYQGNSD